MYAKAIVTSELTASDSSQRATALNAAIFHVSNLNSISSLSAMPDPRYAKLQIAFFHSGQFEVTYN